MTATQLVHQADKTRWIVAGWMLATLAGCASGPQIAASVDRYRLELALDPAAHHLSGRAQLDMVRTGEEPVGDRHAVVGFLLHPDLRVTSVRGSGATVLRHWVDRTPSGVTKAGDFKPATHRVVLDRAHDAFTLTVDYEGDLFQDVSAGERPGEIHNFQMRAHISPEGIYLADGSWYPESIVEKDVEPQAADFTLLASEVPGLELAVGAEHSTDPTVQPGQTAWRTPYPIDGLVVVGGPHEIRHATHGNVDISVHLKPTQAAYADGLLDAVKRNLDRYEPLIGPYPGHEYKIVDNFFSSGFAFPTMTLLCSAVIEMGKRAQTAHGYLDHEMLHSWWGNGILVDPRDGNWCESLTSYATNYYGFVLDGKPDEARRKRRNYSHFLSRIKPENDKPLGTFGLPEGCGRGIAYNKGAAVFHMLAMTMGQERFWAAMRQFTKEYLGRHANWNDIRQLCEQASGKNLEWFFDQWVRRGGAPALRIDSATFDSSDQTLSVTVTQDAPVFTLDLPLRIVTGQGTEDRVVRFDRERDTFDLPVAGEPLTVELDPDYDMFRKIPLDQIIPTTASTRFGSAFTGVTPDGEVPSAYLKLQEVFASSFKKDERVAKTVSRLEEGDLAERCVLIVGDAVRAPYISGFLEAIEFPVSWTETGFELSGVSYDDPMDAVLCTVRHPGVPGGGVTVLYANSEAAIPHPFAVPMYEHSLVIFENGHPTVRLDFEQHDTVGVERS